MSSMKIAIQLHWIAFALTVPISLYVAFFGTTFMGFCPGIECWPHTFAYMLLAPCLLLAIWSLRATAIAAGSLLFAHGFTEIVFYQDGLGALWSTDRGLDKCFWVVVLLLILSALLHRRNANRQGARI